VNYYNDNDPKACAWLRELIAAGHLPPGHVDERSILEINPDDLAGYDQCHFFAGIGGWALALRWAGLEGRAGIWTGSCPCQPLSCAGQRKGHTDERHLWPAFHALIAKRRPATVFGEQVASKDGREWFAGVRLDLEGLGYACGGADLCAAGVGAPHRRQRLFWVADVQRERLEGLGRDGDGRNEPGREHAEAVGHAAESGATGRVAHAEHDGGRSDEPGRKAQGRGVVGRACGGGDAEGDGRQVRTQLHGELRGQGLGEGCESVRLGDSASRGCGERRDAAQPGRGGHADRAGWAGVAAGGMGDAESDDKRGMRQGEPRRGLPTGGPDTPCDWSSFDILPCRDGKARRVEAGTFPLADGIPGRMGLLRGYGNAIVPEVAAEFVSAWLGTMTRPASGLPNGRENAQPSPAARRGDATARNADSRNPEPVCADCGSDLDGRGHCKRDCPNNVLTVSGGRETTNANH